MGIDFGALTGEGGGSCNFDGDLLWVGWSFNEDETVLSAFRTNAETGLPQDTVVWEIVEFDQNSWTADQASIFGPLTYVHTAVAKD